VPTEHTHSLDVAVTGSSRLKRRDPKRDGLGALAALILAALIAATDDPTPLFVMTPAQIDFPASNVGTLSAGRQLTLQNNGAVPIALARLIPSQLGLVRIQSVDCLDGLVPAGRQCVVNVAVTPNAVGSMNAVLALDGANPAVRLTGQGLAVPIVVPVAVPIPAGAGGGPTRGGRGTPGANDRPGPARGGAEPPKPEPPPKPVPEKPPLIAAARFTRPTFRAQAEVDTTRTMQVALQNSGQTTIATASFRFEGGHAGDFTLSQSSCALGAPQKDCSIDVVFTPREAGEHRAVLVAEAGGAELDRTSLLGEASAPSRPLAESLPSSLQFSTRGEKKYFLFYNKGTAPLRFGLPAIDNSKDFELDVKACPSPSVLEAGKSCPVFVTFKGRTQSVGRVTVTHNAPSSPTLVSLSAAGEPAEVPNLSGSDRDGALRRLEDKKLVAGTISEEPRCKDIGRVVDQSPEAKTRVPQGTPVDFTLSSMGRDPAEVPSVRGPRALAERAITNARLRIGGTTPSETDAFAPGSVVDTRPKAGTRLAPNCDVTLVLAVPVPKFPVPGVVGQTFAAAKQALPSGFTGAFSNFRLGAVQGGPVPRGEEGQWTVTAQSPQATLMMPRGTTVDVTVTRAGGILKTPEPRVNRPVDRIEQPVKIN